VADTRKAARNRQRSRAGPVSATLIGRLRPEQIRQVLTNAQREASRRTELNLHGQLQLAQAWLGETIAKSAAADRIVKASHCPQCGSQWIVPEAVADLLTWLRER
jgi:hypothetical protein